MVGRSQAGATRGFCSGHGAGILGTDGDRVIVKFYGRGAKGEGKFAAIASSVLIQTDYRGRIGQTGTIVVDTDMNAEGDFAASKTATGQYGRR